MLLLPLFIFGIFFLTPVVLFLLSYYTSNFNDDYVKSGLEYTGDMTGFNSLPALEFEQEAICDEAYFIGNSNVYSDCSSICNSSNYEYKFIEKSQNVVINNRRLIGAYCLTKKIAKCNLNTSSALVGVDSFKCLSKHPNVLGGENGNTIIACNGVLKDHLLANNI